MHLDFGAAGGRLGAARTAHFFSQKLPLATGGRMKNRAVEAPLFQEKMMEYFPSVTGVLISCQVADVNT